ncbi:hypothetical protein BRD17_01890 [Halobacteriales archaeon SW_7_68_16]|nr:MAG: hypothetical protein BRD17_01890 [Halobacteriales archaeon SW_7_68_16]
MTPDSSSTIDRNDPWASGKTDGSVRAVGRLSPEPEGRARSDGPAGSLAVTSRSPSARAIESTSSAVSHTRTASERRSVANTPRTTVSRSDAARSTTARSSRPATSAVVDWTETCRPPRSAAGGTRSHHAPGDRSDRHGLVRPLPGRFRGHNTRT